MITKNKKSAERPAFLDQLYRPAKDSHKGQNGKLLIIGGSELFHAASRWALLVASRIVDMVFYSSIPQNNQLVKEAKKEFVNGIVIPREKVGDYIKEADGLLIGPGMIRSNETREITNRLLKDYPQQRWLIDAGALQMLDVDLISPNMILTPHHQEFERLFGQEKIETVAKQTGATIVLKGPIDLVCNSEQCWQNQTGNEGMTKGGTGDTLAGLIAALYCKNEAWLAARTGVYFNGLAGDELYEQVGPYFNASDLANQLPRTMKQVLDF